MLNCRWSGLTLPRCTGELSAARVESHRPRGGTGPESARGDLHLTTVDRYQPLSPAVPLTIVKPTLSAPAVGTTSERTRERERGQASLTVDLARSASASSPSPLPRHGGEQRGGGEDELRLSRAAAWGSRRARVKIDERRDTSTIGICRRLMLRPWLRAGPPCGRAESGGGVAGDRTGSTTCTDRRGATTSRCEPRWCSRPGSGRQGRSVLDPAGGASGVGVAARAAPGARRPSNRDQRQQAPQVHAHRMWAAHRDLPPRRSLPLPAQRSTPCPSPGNRREGAGGRRPSPSSDRVTLAWLTP